VVEEVPAKENSFDVSYPTTTQEQSKVFLDFDAATRRDRVTMLTQAFSKEVDLTTAETTASLQQRIAKAKGRAKIELEQELAGLTRFQVIKQRTPGGLFNRIKQTYFDNYLSATMDQRIQAELGVINNDTDYDAYTTEQKLIGATKTANYKSIAYAKIVDNFKTLAE